MCITSCLSLYNHLSGDLQLFWLPTLQFDPKGKHHAGTPSHGIFRNCAITTKGETYLEQSSENLSLPWNSPEKLSIQFFSAPDFKGNFGEPFMLKLVLMMYTRVRGKSQADCQKQENTINFKNKSVKSDTNLLCTVLLLIGRI